MKILSLVALLAIPVTMLAEQGCDAKSAADVEKAAFTTEQVACFLVNAELPASDVAKACNVAQTLAPSIESILGAHRKAVGIPAKPGC